MKVSVQDGKSCEKILKIEIEAELIRKEYSDFYNEIAPKAKIPGFRPGKAPRQVLEMHYKNEAREEVLKHLISHGYGDALEEKEIRPLGYPEISEVDFKDEKLTFRAVVEVRPKIKLSKTSGLNVKKEKVELKPDEVAEALKRMQDSMAQYKVVEDRPSAWGDFLIADYTCSVEGKQIDKRTDDWLELKEDEFLKGFSQQLVGLKPTDEKEVRASFPADFRRKELSGKEAVFQIKVKELKTKTLPPLDDELAKTAGEFKTLAELRDHLEKDMLAHKEHEKEVEFERHLLDEFIKQNKIDLPERVITHRKEKLIEDAVKNYEQRGVPPEKLGEIKKNLEKELVEEARRQVHVAFLLDELAEREKMTVGEEDLKERYQRVSAQVHQPVEVVEKYYTEHEEAREALGDQIRNEKAIEFIKKNAKT